MECPETLALDRGPQFPNEELNSLAHDVEIYLYQSGFGSSNTNSSAKTYHSFLRRILKKPIARTVHINDKLALAFFLKACNDTKRTEGIVLTLLVFGILLQIPIGMYRLPNNNDRVKAILTVWREATKVISQHCLDGTLNTHVPRTADKDLKNHQWSHNVLRKNKSKIGGALYHRKH